MKRLVLISLLSLGCLSDLGAFPFSNYDSYVAAVDGLDINTRNYRSLASTVAYDVTIGGSAVDGLALVVQKEGSNSPRAQKIRGARKIIELSELLKSTTSKAGGVVYQ